MSRGVELDAFIVFFKPLEIGLAKRLLEFEGSTLEFYPLENSQLIRAARVTGDTDLKMALEQTRAHLTEGRARWIEIGARGYAVIDGRREYRPWRKNAYLTLEKLGALEKLEPEVKYHAPG
jgi:hypothetical protein